MKIKITSDSTCDLSPELLRENDIELFPLFINKGDESFRDGVDSTTALPSWQRNMTPCSM